MKGTKRTSLKSEREDQGGKGTRGTSSELLGGEGIGQGSAEGEAFLLRGERSGGEKKVETQNVASHQTETAPWRGEGNTPLHLQKTGPKHQGTLTAENREPPI